VKGLQLDSDTPELEFAAWTTLHDGIRASPAKKAQGLERDEKFDMHLSTLVGSTFLDDVPRAYSSAVEPLISRHCASTAGFAAGYTRS
jgi:hypothetical protein